VVRSGDSAGKQPRTGAGAVSEPPGNVPVTTVVVSDAVGTVDWGRLECGVLALALDCDGAGFRGSGVAQPRLPRALVLGLFEGGRTERVERVGGRILVLIVESKGYRVAGVVVNE
jgi:hypothetical protein